jgi:hypothetical protein
VARPPIDLNAKVRELLTHVADLPEESERPLAHFEYSANQSVALIKYIDDHLPSASIYPRVYERHMGHLRRLVLASMLQSFERLIKELAIACVDHLAGLVDDDRYDEFRSSGSITVVSFAAGLTAGRALCGSSTWSSNKEINDRFKKLLRMPNTENLWEALFPARDQLPAVHRDTAATLSILWQIRHNLSHNVGHLTTADVFKLRALLAGTGPVDAEKLLAPREPDIRHVKSFLIATARMANQRVGHRLATILGSVHAGDAAAFVPQEMADRVSKRIGFPVTVAGSLGVL